MSIYSRCDVTANEPVLIPPNDDGRGTIIDLKHLQTRTTGHSHLCPTWLRLRHSSAGAGVIRSQAPEGHSAGKEFSTYSTAFAHQSPCTFAAPACTRAPLRLAPSLVHWRFVAVKRPRYANKTALDRGSRSDRPTTCAGHRRYPLASVAIPRTPRRASSQPMTSWMETYYQVYQLLVKIYF